MPVKSFPASYAKLHPPLPALKTYGAPTFLPVDPVHECHESLPPGITCGIAVKHIKHMGLALARVGEVGKHDHSLGIAISAPKYQTQTTFGPADNGRAVAGGPPA